MPWKYRSRLTRSWESLVHDTLWPGYSFQFIEKTDISDCSAFIKDCHIIACVIAAMIASEQFSIEIIFRILQAVKYFGSTDLDHSIDRVVDQLLRLDQEDVIADADSDASQASYAIFDVWAISSLMQFPYQLFQIIPLLN